MIAAYCTPLSAAPGETIHVKVSAPGDVRVIVMRLNSADGEPVGEAVHAVEPVLASMQAVPPNAWANGCGWLTSLTLTVPEGWSSGIYTARCIRAAAFGPQEIFDAIFIVKPHPNARAEIAALANVNTWNAYNGWGDYDVLDRSKYDDKVRGSFERPAPCTSPVPDGNVNHLTRAELWILDWLSREIAVDVYTDIDFDAGIPGLDGYRALLLHTHPEYWSIGMWDHLVGYLGGGGSLLYLGGNGIFERCEYLDGRRALKFFDGDAAAGRDRNFFRNLGRPERDLLGVAFRFNNYLDKSKPMPLAVCDANHRFFLGTGRQDGSHLANGDSLGATGRNRAAGQDPSFGAVSGWETDTSDAAVAAPFQVVNAWDPNWPYVAFTPTDRGVPPNNLELLARGLNHEEGPHAADMTCYRHPGGGLVFAAGSIPFGGSLVEDPNLQTVVLNALDEALGTFDQSTARYASVWEQVGEPPCMARHGLSGAEHQALFEQLPAQGWRPRSVSGYTVNGNDWYASVWEQVEGPPWAARHWLTRAEHQALFDSELAPQGFRPRMVSGYTVNGVDRYASVWEQVGGLPWAAHHALRGGAHQRAVNRLFRTGFRPRSVFGYSV